MSAIALSTVRSRTATALSGLSGWRESRYHPDLFGSDPLTTTHKGYAVGIESTTPRTRESGRRVGHQLADTIVAVKWAHRLRADAQVADFDEALDAEQTAIAAVLSMSHTDLSSLSLAGISPRRAAPDGSYLLGEFAIRVTHLYDLS